MTKLDKGGGGSSWPRPLKCCIFDEQLPQLVHCEFIKFLKEIGTVSEHPKSIGSWKKKKKQLIFKY